MSKLTRTGSARVRKSLKLFALNSETGEVYQVKVQENDNFSLESMYDKDKGVAARPGKFKAEIQKDHKMLWALNEKNALRKFANDPANLKILAKNGDSE